MKTRLLLTVFAFLKLATYSVAQGNAAPALQVSLMDTVGLPGRTWTSLGNLSPIEHNNGYVESYFEQGATVFAAGSGSITVTPYVSLGLALDTKGYPWNNKVQPQMGVKLNKFFRMGVVSLGTAYTYEDRFDSATSSGLTFYLEDWFGWESVAQRQNRFPGSSWAVIGRISPVEHGNILGQAYFSQGFVAKRWGRTALVPFGEITVYRDRQGFDWDNKAQYGGGLKAIIPRGDFYTEAGAAFLRENRFQSGLAASGLTVFANFSFGWNLMGRRAGR